MPKDVGGNKSADYCFLPGESLVPESPDKMEETEHAQPGINSIVLGLAAAFNRITHPYLENSRRVQKTTTAFYPQKKGIRVSPPPPQSPYPLWQN